MCVAVFQVKLYLLNNEVGRRGAHVSVVASACSVGCLWTQDVDACHLGWPHYTRRVGGGLCTE